MNSSYGAGANTLPGNEGPLKVHKNGKEYLLKLKMNHSLWNIIQHKDKDVLEVLRDSMYGDPEFNSPKWKSVKDKVEYLKDIANRLLGEHLPMLHPFSNVTEKKEKKEPVFSKVFDKFKPVPNVGEFILVKWDGVWDLVFVIENEDHELCCVEMKNGGTYRFEYEETVPTEWKYPEKVILEAY